MNDKTEDTLRSALERRAGSIGVGDPHVGVKQRIAALRHRRRRRLALGSAAVAIVVAAVALAPTLATDKHDRRTAALQGSGPGVLASRLVRDTHPLVPASALAALTNANTRTAIDLYHQLAATPGNVFFSPYSITTALTMAAAGARGQTLAQMLAVLHDTLPAATLHDATDALNLALLAPRSVPATVTGDPLELEVANSVWSQTGYHIEPGFLDLLARDYGAALNTVDYEKNAVGAVVAINSWVDAHTNHMIPNLLSQLDPFTRLVLVNAVHFKGSWAQPFPAGATDNAGFTTPSGKNVAVPFMHGVIDSGYAKGPGWQAVDVPYIGGASMTMIVPDAGTFARFEQGFDSAGLAHIIGSLSAAHVTLAMPKLQLDDKSKLGPMLERLGMTDAFTGSADFSGITGNRDLAISEVVHEAKVTIDEKGTEAAAATAVGMYTSGTRISRANFTLDVDRPYLMLIRDDRTGAVLFLGRVTDPMQTQVQQ